MSRKTPRRHPVRQHRKSDGTRVRAYHRGRGTHRRISKLVGGAQKPKNLTVAPIEPWFSVVRGDLNELGMEGALIGKKDELQDITYDDMINILGLPSYFGSPDNKTKATWIIKIGDDVVSIWDYKEYRTPLEEITDWSVGGGAPRKDVDRIRTYIIRESMERRKK